MGSCLCGCGTETATAFAPGHDQKLRVALEQRVGGLGALKALVEAVEQYMLGETGSSDLTKEVRHIFAQKHGGL